MIDLYASQPHYADHLDPIWQALPEHLRGQRWAHTVNCWWGGRRSQRQPALDRPVLVAGYTDARAMYPRPVVYVEHGAGQQYVGLPAGENHYPGGEQPDANVIGWICPSERVAATWPGPAIAAGCPKLDRWFGAPRPTERVLAVTWHWRCRLLPETLPAWPHYKPAMRAQVAAWRADGWEVIGHHHPRDDRMRHDWQAMGVRVAGVDEVFERAQLLIADNTSLLYEFAALDRPVLVLNAPWYRRHVNHGLRFWDLVPGHMIDGPAELAALDLDQYVLADVSRPHRERVMPEVYAGHGCHAALRAAEFISQLIGA